MAIIMYDGKQIAGGGVSIVHMTEQQYLQNKTALDASDLLIEITDKDYPVEAGNIGFTPPTGMSATNVQGAIEEVNGKTLLIVSDRHNITSQSVALQTQSFLQVDVTRAGYNAVGIMGCVTYDSSLNLLPLDITGFSCNATTAYIELFNSTANTQTVTSVFLTIAYTKA